MVECLSSKQRMWVQISPVAINIRLFSRLIKKKLTIKELVA